MKIQDLFESISSLNEKEDKKVHYVKYIKDKGKWALVSKYDGKVLRYYDGEGKPTKEWEDKAVGQIHYFEKK